MVWSRIVSALEPEEILQALDLLCDLGELLDRVLWMLGEIRTHQRRLISVQLCSHIPDLQVRLWALGASACPPPRPPPKKRPDSDDARMGDRQQLVRALADLVLWIQSKIAGCYRGASEADRHLRYLFRTDHPPSIHRPRRVLELAAHLSTAAAAHPRALRPAALHRDAFRRLDKLRGALSLLLDPPP